MRRQVSTEAVVRLGLHPVLILVSLPFLVGEPHPLVLAFCLVLGEHVLYQRIVDGQPALGAKAANVFARFRVVVAIPLLDRVNLVH